MNCSDLRDRTASIAYGLIGDILGARHQGGSFWISSNSADTLPALWIALCRYVTRNNIAIHDLEIQVRLIPIIYGIFLVGAHYRELIAHSPGRGMSFVSSSNPRGHELAIASDYGSAPNGDKPLSEPVMA